MAHLTDVLAVNEIFRAIQGEGKQAGMPCFFLRLAGCNLHCSWCDTPYSWDWENHAAQQEIHPMPVGDVRQEIIRKAGRSSNLVVTGGEPLLQEKTLKLLTLPLLAEHWWVEIETNGTIFPSTSMMASQYTVSPKLANSGMPEKMRIKRDVLTRFYESWRAVFKFVVGDLDDFVEIDALVQELGLHPVYIMPEGIDADTLLERGREIAPKALKRGYFFTSRLQVLLYGNKRGV